MARILLVEDDSAVRAFVERALQLDGHDVETASDGGLGLELLEETLAAGDAYDLLLSDIQMPIMDGIGLALTAAQKDPNMPILLMTGYAEQRERATNLSRVIVDVVAKPFTLPDIRKAVAEALATGGSGSDG
ncbi:MAG: response regulator [Pseudomonadota bacterium]